MAARRPPYSLQGAGEVGLRACRQPRTGPQRSQRQHACCLPGGGSAPAAQRSSLESPLLQERSLQRPDPCCPPTHRFMEPLPPTTASAAHTTPYGPARLGAHSPASAQHGLQRPAQPLPPASPAHLGRCIPAPPAAAPASAAPPARPSPPGTAPGGGRGGGAGTGRAWANAAPAAQVAGGSRPPTCHAGQFLRRSAWMAPTLPLPACRRPQNLWPQGQAQPPPRTVALATAKQASVEMDLTSASSLMNVFIRLSVSVCRRAGRAGAGKAGCRRAQARGRHRAGGRGGCSAAGLCRAASGSGAAAAGHPPGRRRPCWGCRRGRRQATAARRACPPDQPPPRALPAWPAPT